MIILDNVPHAPHHNGGGLIFDDDRRLYISTGDALNSSGAQDLSILSGKLLRIQITDSGYSIPPENPFIEVPGAQPEVYAYGLRNPFRMVRRASDGAIFIADVGENHWEEVNQVHSGANYGWPIREGICPLGQYTPCSPAPPEFTDPVFYYPHPSETTGSAITAVAFYEGERFPVEYQDLLFFADFDDRYIATTHLDHRRRDAFEITRFLNNAGSIVDITYHDEALYFVDIFQGKIHKISYVGPENEIPVGQLSADVRLGPPPLTVTFSSEGSTAPEGTSLYFEWDFGDGTTLTTTEEVVSHTYTTEGNFSARMIAVTDDGRRASTLTEKITVYAGEIPEIELTILNEPARIRFYGGDRVRYAASLSNTNNLGQDTPFSWQLALHHNQHIHPIIYRQKAVSGTYEISPKNHGGSWNIWYRFSVTMQTTEGIEVTVSADLMPNIVDVGLETDPFTQNVAKLTLDQVQHGFPHTMTTITGMEHEVDTRDILFYNRNVYIFSNWTIPGQTTYVMFTAPLTDAIYTAQFDYLKPASTSWLALLLGDR